MSFRVGQRLVANKDAFMVGTKSAWLLKNKVYTINQINTPNGLIRITSEISCHHYVEDPDMYFDKTSVNKLIRVL